MIAGLRRKVQGWGEWPGVVLVMMEGRVVDTVQCERGRTVLYALRYRGDEFDDLWFKSTPVERLEMVEAEYRDRYGLAQRLTKK